MAGLAAGAQTLVASVPVSLKSQVGIVIIPSSAAQGPDAALAPGTAYSSDAQLSAAASQVIQVGTSKSTA